MKEKAIKKLIKGDLIEHSHYGLCIVDSHSLLGLIIRPLTAMGVAKLFADSDVPFNRFLEDKNRCILRKAENQTIPLIIGKTDDEDKYNVYKWIEPGIWSEDKGLSIKEEATGFDTLEEAEKFINDARVSKN